MIGLRLMGAMLENERVVSSVGGVKPGEAEKEPERGDGWAHQSYSEKSA